jgi:S-adenosylmethionine hydrolase
MTSIRFSKKDTRSVQTSKANPSGEKIGQSNPSIEERGSIITLLTDFGNRDGYVGAMKGVILSINPQAQIVDISHTIQSHRIQEGAFVLKSAYPFYPKDTIHLVVVDPGVGSDRKPIIVETESHLFVGPDNGIFSYIFEENATKVWEINERKYFLLPQSDTFHGRDIFSPVAAYLSLGTEVSKIASIVNEFSKLPIPRPAIREEEIGGHILHVDCFGNLITDIPKRFMEKRDSPSRHAFEFCSASGEPFVRIHRMSRTYSEGISGEVIALIGSSGLLEFSVNEGRADEVIPVKAGDAFLIRFSKTGRPVE